VNLKKSFGMVQSGKARRIADEFLPGSFPLAARSPAKIALQIHP
jgi:hypothetical protein